jgi:hypothetical protein
MSFHSTSKTPSRQVPQRAGKRAPRPYDRLQQLPKLIGLWPSELTDGSAKGAEKILALLRKALRAERARGRAGHWTYDLNRHMALSESLKAEEARLHRLMGAARMRRREAGRSSQGITISWSGTPA